jgi:hypothetical protein
MLGHTVDELVDTDISLLSDAAMRVEFLEVRRLIDRLESYAARLLEGVHGRGIPAGDGASSTPVWVQLQTGQRLRDGRLALATGKACETLPLVAKAWAQSEISANAAATIAQGRRARHKAVYATIEEQLVGSSSSATSTITSSTNMVGMRRSTASPSPSSSPTPTAESSAAPDRAGSVPPGMADPDHGVAEGFVTRGDRG